MYSKAILKGVISPNALIKTNKGNTLLLSKQEEALASNDNPLDGIFNQ